MHAEAIGLRQLLTAGSSRMFDAAGALWKPHSWLADRGVRSRTRICGTVDCDGFFTAITRVHLRAAPGRPVGSHKTNALFEAGQLVEVRVDTAPTRPRDLIARSCLSSSERLRDSINSRWLSERGDDVHRAERLRSSSR